MRDVKCANAVDEVVCCGHVAPGAEFVDFNADGVDDVVDAVLYDNRAGASNIHFNGESRGAFEAVGGIGDATVFTQNACTADCTADDGDIVESFAGAAEREVIGPVLCRDGIAEADECEIFFFGENIDCIEEVNPVCFAREVIGECYAFGEISVAVFASRKRACDCRAGVHLCEISEVKADIECFACGHVEWNFVAQDFFARGNCGCGATAKSDGGWMVIRRWCGFGDVCFADGYRLGASEVRKMEAQFVPRKAGANRIAEC